MEAIETKTLTPRELAEVIGVSQSSIKRWVDDGLIDVHRTAGGHRRIPLREALRFARQRQMQIVRPELVGLPDLEDVPPEAREGEFTGDVLFHLLRRGEAARARGILATEYLNGAPLAGLFDGPVAEALARLGVLWQESDEGIYVEHMATNICIEAINQVRLLMPPPADDAPVALGGAPSGDPYVIPSLMAAAVLADAGYHVTNLGPNTPAAALLHAASVHTPNVVWLAVTAPFDAAEMRTLVSDLIRPLADDGVAVALGGRHALTQHAATLPDAVWPMHSMQDLADFAAQRSTA